MSICTRLKKQLCRLSRRENGNATVELAIVFPVLLLLFVGTAELGRLFYTYTTLAKATKTGARFLSNADCLRETDAEALRLCKLQAQSLVVCGYESCSGNGPDGNAKKPLVDGLNMGDPSQSVSVTVFTQTEGTDVITYVSVQIQNYNYPRGVFTLSGVTGAADSVIYRALTPRTTLRYLLAT